MSDITEVKEQLAIILTNNNTVEGLADDFNNLYAQIGTDETAVALMTSAWDRVQALATTVDQAAALAQVAVEVANEMVTQRDAIADELSTVAKKYKGLSDAVDSADTDHPDVAALIEMVSESVHEQAWEDIYQGDGIHEDTPGETAVENGHLHEDILANEVETFLWAVMGYGDPLSDELNKRLSDFIIGFVPDIRIWYEQEEARRAAEYEARRKAKAAEALANGQ